MEQITLNNKLECPVIGIGTFMLSPAEAENSVREALKMGYHLIDTANAYVNERAVGRGMKDSGVSREKIFLSTKLWPSEYENENAVDETLERLGVEYVDLLYIHQPAGNWLAGYRQLEKAYKEGKAKSIGISNFEGTPFFVKNVILNGYDYAFFARMASRIRFSPVSMMERGIARFRRMNRFAFPTNRASPPSRRG